MSTKKQTQATYSNSFKQLCIDEGHLSGELFHVKVDHGIQEAKWLFWKLQLVHLLELIFNVLNEVEGRHRAVPGRGKLF